MADDPRDAEIAVLRASLDQLAKENRIASLSVPLEEELSARIDDLCKHLAMEDGFTLAGIARLLNDCQRRMADDWIEKGNLLRERQAAEAALVRLRKQLRQLLDTWKQWNAKDDGDPFGLERISTRDDLIEDVAALLDPSEAAT